MALVHIMSSGLQIKTTYHGPTDHRGSRIHAAIGAGRSVSVPYDYALDSDDNHFAAAEALCLKYWIANLPRRVVDAETGFEVT